MHLLLRNPNGVFGSRSHISCLTLTSGCLSLHWQAWKDRDVDPWVVEVLRVGYRIPFLSVPLLSSEPISMVSYSPSSIKGKALEEVHLSLVQRDVVELAPLPSPGFYSRMLVVWKTSGLWRPVIDLSVLNCPISKTPFRMETIPSVPLSIRRGDWMISIDLKEAYLQVPIHMDSCKFLDSFGLSVLASPRLPKFSPGLWLWFCPFFTVLISGSAVTWTTGLFRLTLGRKFSIPWRWFFPSAAS